MSKSEEENISNQAAHWFALLLEEHVEEAELAGFRVWLEADSRHAQAYSRLEQLWSGAGMVPDLSQTQLSRRKLLKGGATGLALLLAGGGYYQFSVNRPDYYSATGKVEAAVLPDGSKLRLSSASSVSVHFTEQKRLVKLIAGEAFFDVAPDNTRPFTVSAMHVNTTALGTAFSVRHEDDGVSVVVSEHSVRVETPSQSVEVEERYAVRSRGNNLSIPEPAELDTRLSWLDGRLVFISRPLGEVIKELEQWQRGKIIVTDAALAQRPVTLIINIERTDQLTQKLAEALPVRVENWTPLLTLIRPL